MCSIPPKTRSTPSHTSVIAVSSECPGENEPGPSNDGASSAGAPAVESMRGRVELFLGFLRLSQIVPAPSAPSPSAMITPTTVIGEFANAVDAYDAAAARRRTDLQRQHRDFDKKINNRDGTTSSEVSRNPLDCARQTVRSRVQTGILACRGPPRPSCNSMGCSFHA